MKTRALIGRANCVKKRMYTCIGGPMHRHKLWLTGSPTIVFTLKGQTGRYQLPKMNGKTTLFWRVYERGV